MNVDTNELINAKTFEELKKIKTFEPIPDELEHAAKVKLAGRSSAIISKISGGKLSQWAAKQRKIKRKAQKIARKKNR